MEARVQKILVGATSDVLADVSSEIDAAQVEAEDRHAFLAMDDTFLEALTGGSNTGFSTPSDWIRPSSRWTPYYNEFGDDGEREAKHLKWAPTTGSMHKTYTDLTDEDEPKYIEHYATSGILKLRVYPVPDQAYNLIIPYVRHLDPPSTASPQNWFMKNADRYLVWKAASELLTLSRNFELSTYYMVKAEGELQRLIRADRRSKQHGDTLPVRRDANAPFNQRMR